MSLQYKIIPVTSYKQNCSIVWCDETMEGVIIDPGGESDLLLETIQMLGINLLQIILTHGHLDHVGGTIPLKLALDVNVIGPHQDDRFWLDSLEEQSRQFGLTKTDSFLPDRWLNEGDVLSFGQQQLDVFHTPGHTPGHVILFNQNHKLAFVGDVLFKGGVGRSDFPLGDHQVLIESIKSKLWPLGNDVQFIPGHGPDSTFGHERLTNPFVADEMPIY